MPRFFCFAVLFASCLQPLVGFSSRCSAEEPATPPQYQLPKDPQTPVIVLNYLGGFTPPKTSNEPTMSILPDGTVEIPQKFAQAKAYRGKLSQAELQQLLRFILETNDYKNYDQAAIAQKIAAEKQRIAAGGGAIFRLADAATAQIEVNVNGKKIKSSYYPSGIDESGIPELSQRAAIQKRLQQVMAVIKIGGKAEVAKWLKQANTALLAAHPKAKPLTADDFRFGSERADGSMYVSFNRQQLDANGKPVPRHVTGVTINQPAGGEPKFNVTYLRPDTQN